MVKSFRTFLEDCQREIPDDIVNVTEEVNPANYDVTAIIKHLGAMKRFPLLIFERPLNLHGRVADFKIAMNFATTQRKAQIALGVPETMSRPEMAEVCLDREHKRITPIVIHKEDAPVKEVVKLGADVDLFDLPILRHHEMDGGPYITLCTIAKDRKDGIYNASYHRMEVKTRNTTSHYHSQHHQWIIFRDYEEKNLECPVATVLGHHPAFYMGACYTGPFEVSEYDVIGGYLQEPLRLTPSETWGDELLIPADAEIVIEGALIPNKRVVDGPFGEAPGYLGPQRFSTCAEYQVRAINYRKGGYYQSVITPEGDKPWLDLPREGTYLRRIREAVPGVTAVCKHGRHSHYNIFISMKKMSEGDPGRAAAAALTELHAKHIFVFDDDIDVYNPTEILWAIATRVQAHQQIAITPPLFTGNYLDPTVVNETKTSVMIVDATRPIDRPFSPVSRCPEDAMARVKLEKFIKKEILQRVPTDRTSYWS